MFELRFRFLTGEEAEDVRVPSNAAVVWVLQLEGQQVLEPKVAEVWQRSQPAATQRAQAIAHAHVRAVHKVGVQERADRVDLHASTWRNLDYL